MTIPKNLQKFPIYQYGFYSRVFDHDALDTERHINDAEYLFSFIGKASNHLVRSNVLKLKHPRALLKDNSSFNTALENTYIEILHNSKFVLCPRGIGASTIRVFEIMRAGRIPVIISDEWSNLQNIPWSEFSIRVPENEVFRIPELLESLEDKSEEMGTLARQVWKKNFP